MRNVETAKIHMCSSCRKASANWIRDLNGINGQSGVASVPDEIDDNVEVPDVCDTIVVPYDGKELWCPESYLPVESFQVVEILSRPFPRSDHNLSLSGYVYAKSEDGRVGWLPQAVLANRPFFKPPPPPPTTPPPPLRMTFQVSSRLA